MKAKRYSGSTSLRNYAVTTKAGAAKYSTLPDQLWDFFLGVRYPYLFFLFVQCDSWRDVERGIAPPTLLSGFAG
jgi:hypothetical protein